MTRRSIYLSLAVIVAFAALLLVAVPRVRADSPAFTVTTSGDVVLPAQTVFTHSYTVTNTGDAAGAAGVWETTSAYIIVVSTPAPQCAVYYGSLHGGGKVQAGTYCNLGTIEPGASVTVTETFKTKYGPVCPTVAVNRRSPVDAHWCVTIQ